MKRAHLEALTELEQFCHTLFHLILHQCLLLLGEPVLLIGYEISKRRKRIRRRLLHFSTQVNPLFATTLKPDPHFCWHRWTSRPTRKHLLGPVGRIDRYVGHRHFGLLLVFFILVFILVWALSRHRRLRCIIARLLAASTRRHIGVSPADDGTISKMMMSVNPGKKILHVVLVFLVYAAIINSKSTFLSDMKVVRNRLHGYTNQRPVQQ